MMRATLGGRQAQAARQVVRALSASTGMGHPPGPPQHALEQVRHPAWPHFDPTWRDDGMDFRAVNAPLLMPEAVERTPGAKLWVSRTYTSTEMVYEQPLRLDSPRAVTAIVKPSELATDSNVKLVKMTGDGKSYEPAHPEYAEVLFPPKAWMTDSAEERCMMYMAAREARGRVLVGGLGLAVYPQFLFMEGVAKGPVHSVTIIERDPWVIDLMARAWLDHAPARVRECVTIQQATIEDYLATSPELYDTVYLDTWEDADPRLLPHINDLAVAAAARCTPQGRVHCWGYFSAVRTFMAMALMLRRDFNWDRFNLDPALERFSEWARSDAGRAAIDDDDAVTAAAWEAAVTARQPLQSYDRHGCYTLYGSSLADLMMRRQLAKKN